MTTVCPPERQTRKPAAPSPSPVPTSAPASQSPSPPGATTGVLKPASIQPKPHEIVHLPSTDPETLFQAYFKSIGPRRYAAQLQRASNGNHYLVLTESKPDKETKELRRTKLYIYSEDFDAFFNLMRHAFHGTKEHPVPANIAAKQQAYWKNPRGNKKRGGPPRSRPNNRSHSTNMR